MQQILQDLGTGETRVVEVPVPAAGAGQVLIHTHCTLISAGTERMLADFGRASLVQKALQQPEKVRQVLEKMGTDGVFATLDAVRSKLDQPLPLGYCNVGTVARVGAGVNEFKPGDRVVSNGSHATMVSVPKNLCARIPDGVSDEAAVFAIIGAIGLQGLRLAQPTIGEAVVVTGLGLIGLLTVQMLRAHGCRVLGVDFDPARLELARSFGAETASAASPADLLAKAHEFSRGRGVDAVIITASTASSEPVQQAAHMCRKRGRIVLVGVAGLELSRQDFYEKELSFHVSCSYGPGRYDATYEQKGQDYPVGFVRWTEQRNFEAVLDLMASGAVQPAPLITHRFPLAEAGKAYDVLTGDAPSLGIVLQHPADDTGHDARTVALAAVPLAVPAGASIIGCIGAGNYGGRVLLPALAATSACLDTIVTSSGVNAVFYGKKFGFARASTDSAEIFNNTSINTVVIATRHDSHATLAARALRTGRHVYVEKPLALDAAQLTEVEEAYGVESGARRPILMVGFNRRFSPHVQRMQALLRETSGPKALTLLMNAGAIPPGHWTQDPQTGGGRILGEACHLIDLARFLIGAPIVRAAASAMRPAAGTPSPDTAQLTLNFADGSLASIQYYANGHRTFPKERVEAFAGGRMLQLDNYRVLRSFGWPKARGFRTWRQDKGHGACVRAFLEAVEQGGPAPIPAAEIFEVSRVAIELSVQLGQA